MGNEQIIMPVITPLGNPKDTEQIKIIGLLHFIGNILSGGILGTLLVVVYLFITTDITPLAQKTIYNIINFNISFVIYGFIGFLLIFILIGFLILPVVLIVWFIALIIGFIKHLAGENYVYPVSIPFLK